jgi:hypothetical protein
MSNLSPDNFRPRAAGATTVHFPPVAAQDVGRHAKKAM